MERFLFNRIHPKANEMPQNLLLLSKHLKWNKIAQERFYIELDESIDPLHDLYPGNNKNKHQWMTHVITKWWKLCSSLRYFTFSVIFKTTSFTDLRRNEQFNQSMRWWHSFSKKKFTLTKIHNPGVALVYRFNFQPVKNSKHCQFFVHRLNIGYILYMFWKMIWNQ